MVSHAAPSSKRRFLFGATGATPEGLRGIADQAHARILEDPPGTGFIEQLFEGMTLDAQMELVLMRLARESDRRTVPTRSMNWS